LLAGTVSGAADPDPIPAKDPTMSAPSTALPNDCETWDLQSYFPALDSESFRSFFADLERDIAAYRDEALHMPAIEAGSAAQWAALLTKVEELGRRLSHVGSYLSCLTAQDANDEKALAEQGRLSRLGAESSKMWVAISTHFREVSREGFDALCARPELAPVRFRMERILWSAQHMMPADQELLAADMNVDGLSAWGRLYDVLAGKLEFEMKMPDGTVQKRPMAQRRALLEHADAAIRKAAFEGSNAAWAGVEHIAAAALNHISGLRLTLYRHRGHGHFLEPALFDSCVTEKTLRALMAAIEQEIDLPRRFLAAKARLLGVERLGFQDIAAPLPIEDHRTFSWTEAKKLILDSFAVYPELRDYSARAFEKRWVESEPRAGKRPGAFCTSSSHTRESRVFMTYNGTIHDILTLAHELGHAFHNYVLRDTRPFARSYPMTLAETASTFAEALVMDSILKMEGMGRGMIASVLNSQLTSMAVFLMDIPMRFRFEEALYTERAKGELSVSRLKALMVEMQKKCFAGTLDEAQTDPYFWASKLHFYITGVSFYNFPYTFGYLFARGLFAKFAQQGPAFFRQYEEALLLTGSATAEAVVAKAIGEDIEKPDFWVRAIRSHETEIREFNALAGLKG
jgi:oligoendopeptidase F